MTITLNGEPREVAAPGSVEDLVAALGLPLNAALVEHNGLALLRREWPVTPVRDGDRIEIIRMVAGG